MMNFQFVPFSSVWHIFISLIIFFSGAYVANKVLRRLPINNKIGLTLYCWHTLFCIIYLFYVLNYGGDALGYFRKASIGWCEFGVGTNAIQSFLCLLLPLDIPLLGFFLLFNVFGSIGLLFLASSLHRFCTVKYLKIFVYIMLFLPSVSFWSSAIGKDSISFMSTCIALWAAINLKQRKGLMLFAIISMFIVRPHMAGILLLALCFSVVFDKRTDLKLKLPVFVISLALSLVLIPFALQYAGVNDNVTAETLQGYIEDRQTQNLSGGSSLDISSMSLHMQMFTYLFRPLPYEIYSITTLLSSLDNMFLLVVFIFGIKHLSKGKYDKANRLFLWGYSFGALLVLSLTTANLGIAMRQKWMFVPVLFYLFISAIFYAKHNKLNKKNE